MKDLICLGLFSSLLSIKKLDYLVYLLTYKKNLLKQKCLILLFVTFDFKRLNSVYRRKILCVPNFVCQFYCASSS